MSDWVFHFRNFDPTETWFSVYHAGCGGAPWHDGRPRCWHNVIGQNPTGGDNSVYNPSDWVIGFGSWWKIITDALELVAEIGVLIASEGESASALKSTIKDAFNLGDDIAEGIVANYFAEHANLAEAVHESRRQAAIATATTVDQITFLAEQMGLGSTGWVYYAGKPFTSLVHDDNKYNDSYGWSLLCNPHGPKKHIGNVIANHTFIQGGQMHFCWSSDLYGPVNKETRVAQIGDNIDNLLQGAQPVYPDTLNLWTYY